MIRNYLTLALIIILASCSNGKSDFAGEWKCDEGSNIYKFEKINENSYLYYYESGKSETATITANGVLEMRGFVFTLNEDTDQLILPNAWSCNTATRIK